MSHESTLDFKILEANKNIIARNYWSKRFNSFSFEGYFNGACQFSSAPAKHQTAEYVTAASDEVNNRLTEIAETSKAQGIILFATLGILIERFSTSDDIFIFCPVFKSAEYPERNRNVLPIRIGNTCDIIFKDFITSLKNNLIQDLEFSNYPLEKILDMKMEQIQALSAIGMCIEDIQDPTGLELLSLGILFSFDVSDSLTLTVKYKSENYTSQFIESISNSFFNLLSNLLANLKINISDVETVGTKEKQELLNLFNYSEVGYLREKTIINLFSEQVQKTPSNVALKFNEEELTYNELDIRSTQLALILRDKGVRANVVVGLLMERSINTIIGMLAILKAGGAYLPIDVDFPVARQEYMIENSRTEIVLTSKDISPRFLKTVAVLYIEDVEKLEMSNKRITYENKPSDLCYVIYTSGTTGNPKGVMVEHLNVVRLLFNDKFQFSFDSHDVWTMFHSHCFDFSVWEMYGALLFGGKLIIVPQSLARDTNEYLKMLKREQVTVLNKTPSSFYNLVQEDLKTLESSLKLKYVIFGGEALSTGKLKLWRDKYPNVKLINMYGITETTVHCTFKEIGDAEIENNINNVGVPLPTLSLYIFDKNQKLLPKGVIGELYVGGLGVSRGYIGNKELTDKRFIKNPYNPEERLYRSGDLLKIMSCDELEYHGRIDDQVKIRGFRIELGEIETHLAIHPLIKSPLVLVREKEQEQHIVAYYVAEEELPVSELRELLLDKLPDYMIPSYFVHLVNYPLTTNGKLDKKALPEPTVKVSERYQPPSNIIEEQLVSIWGELLKLEREIIGIDRNFFEMGGNSLLAVSLKNKILQSLDSEFSLSDVYKFQDIRHQAKHIDTSGKTKYISIPQSNNQGPFELSAVQKRLYFLYQFDKNSTVYNMPSVVNLNGELDTKKFERAICLLTDRHEILRTAYRLEDGVPMQYVDTNCKCGIDYFDAEGADVENIIKKYRVPFDLSKTPLFRVGLIKKHSTLHILIFDIHHIISDGTSQTILINEFIALYNSQALRTPHIQYFDYIEWKQKAEQQNGLETQKAFWIKQFSTIPQPLNLPVDFNRPSQLKYNGDTVVFQLSAEETEVLRLIARRENTSMYMVLLAIYNVLLSKLAKVEDVTIGTITSGRHHPDLEDMVGLFANTLVLRNKPFNGLTFKEFLSSVKSNTIQCLNNQDYQYDELIDALEIERNASRNPLFDVFFAFHNQDQADLSSNFNVSPYTVNYNLSKFDLTLNARELSDNLSLEFEYSTELFTKNTIEQFVRSFKQIVSSITDDTEVFLQDIDIIDPSEKTLLLSEFNFTDVSYLSDKTIVDVFEEQVLKTPDRIAIEFRGETISYSVLNERANQISNDLIRRGAQSETIVGLFLDRTIETIVAILAVIKSGAAYLPIDIDSPPERVNLLLEDSQVLLLLTSKDFDNKLEVKIPKILIDEFSENYKDKGNPVVKRNADALCYIIYTSGTTGKPKGVMVNYSNLMSIFFNDSFCFDFSSSDVWTMFHRYCFDFSVWEMYGALLFGGKLILISKQDSIDPSVFREILIKNKVTVLNQTPTAFNSLIQTEMEEQDERLMLRYVIFGGEALNPGSLKKWYRRYPDTKLVNMFGITETTIHVTYKEIGINDIESSVSNIGKPLPVVSGYILDTSLKVIPRGFEGELYVGGAGVTRGYINNVELTHEKFLENPYQKGDRLYRTGDLVKILASGELEYKGRVDDQVQLKGFRIELGEIEHVLMTYRFIKEAKVFFTKKENDIYLTAYYVADSDIEIKQLRKILAKKIPLYMIPSYYMRVEKMPLTTNGKVDIKKLPEPEILSKDENLPPSTKSEQLLYTVWIEVLGLGKCGITDNYFALGGDSILAIRLIAAVNKQLSTNIRVIDLYNNQTIKELSTFIESFQFDNEDVDYQEVRMELKAFHDNYVTHKFDERIEVVYPMSNIEKGMSYVHLKNIKDILYYEQLVWPVYYERFDHDKLEKAVYLLTQKHSAFRTAFDLSEFAHIIYKEVAVDIPYVDITNLNKLEQESRIKYDMQNSRSKHFTLSLAPLWKMKNYKLDNNKHVIIFEIHHAISDGWSIATFLNELNNTYRELLINDLYKPTQLKNGYKDFITEEILYNKKNPSLSYWKQELNDFKKFNFAIRATKKKYKTKRIYFENEVYRNLENHAVKINSSVKNLFFAAYIYSLKLLNYENDIVVGLVTFNRAFGGDGTKVFGNFLNTVPVRLKFHIEHTTESLLKMVDEKLLEVKQHDRASLFDINKALGVNYYEGNPITDTLFNFTNFHSLYDTTLEKVVENKEAIDVKSFVRGHSLFDVSVNGVNGDCFVNYDYVTSFIDETLLKKFHTYFTRILQLFIKPSISTLKPELIIDKSEIEQFHRFNDTRAPFRDEKNIVELFEEAVSDNPSTVAVVSGNDALSYRELDEKSTLLSDYIRQNGAVENSIIGISVERSCEMMIGIFAILKANCAYLPINPLNPVDRNNYMLDDANVNIILTQNKFIKNFSYRNNLQVFDIERQDLYNSSLGTKNKVLGSPLSVAYVLYTSGSTGKPKGVAIEHRSIINRLNWMQRLYPIDKNDVLIQKTAITFDVSVWELFWGLFHGSKLVMLEPEGEKKPLQIVDCIEKHKVTVMHFVPSMMNVFMDEFSSREVEISKLKSLKYVFSSGEALLPENANKFNKLLSRYDTKVVNLYGPTEATIDVTYFNCFSKNLSLVPIGKPIDNIKLSILDKNNNLLPIGVLGELFISGIGLARGYMNKLDLTHSKFIQLGGSDEVVYRTGDMARWLPDGNVEYIGRIDTQIKIRGNRIELGEIENVLLGFPGINDVCVISKVTDGENRMVGYYTSKQKQSSLKVKAHLRKQLPEYMIPSFLIQIDAIPLSANGKSDRRALLENSNPEIDKIKPSNTPSTHFEKEIAKLWMDELGIDNIAMEDIFFDVGGHSLLAIKTASKMRDIFGLEPDLADFINQTFAQFVRNYEVRLKKYQP